MRTINRLVLKVGGGRVPVIEVLVNNGRIVDRIIDPTLTSEINQIIEEGEFYGMQTFEASLLGLVRRGLVSIEDALEASSDPHDLSLRLQQAGLTVQA